MKAAIKNINPIPNSNGFTLIELMVAVAISGFAVLLIGNVFIYTNKMNTIQENVAAVQQDIRAALDIMSMDILMAGFDEDPDDTEKFGFINEGNYITASDSIALSYANNGNDVKRCYYYKDKDDPRLMLRSESEGVYASLTADGIISKVNFSYELKDGTVTANPSAQLDKIRLVTVKICGKITGTYATDHPNEYCFSRTIKPRNLHE